MTNTKQLLLKHFKLYPMLEVQDIFKLLYQSSFGCEHMISDQESVTEYIKKEAEKCIYSTDILTEELDGEYVRIHLEYLKKGLSAETLGKLFFLSAQKEPDGEKALKEKISAAKELVNEGLTPFSSDEFFKALEKWKSDGYAPIHHSDSFRNEYSPAYRVVSKKYLPYLPVFAEIDTRLKNGSMHLAIEGGCASGKSTFADILKEIYGCTVFHMDDFFLRSEQRTKERFAEAGGNIDRERFLSEVLEPYKNGGSVSYRRFDCSTFTVMPPVSINKTALTITEGVYCMHPLLSDYYDFSVFLNISEELQKERILKRNSPQFAERFFREWIPMEKRYFDEMNVKNRCSIIIDIY